MTPMNEREKEIIKRYRKAMLLDVKKLTEAVKDRDIGAYQIKHICDKIECLAFEAVNTVLELRGEL